MVIFNISSVEYDDLLIPRFRRSLSLPVLLEKKPSINSCKAELRTMNYLAKPNLSSMSSESLSDPHEGPVRRISGSSTVKTLKQLSLQHQSSGSLQKNREYTDPFGFHSLASNHTLSHCSLTDRAAQVSDRSKVSIEIEPACNQVKVVSLSKFNQIPRSQSMNESEVTEQKKL